MVTRRVSGNESSEPPKKRRRATTPEARENQLIALAVDLSEQQLRDGSASSQVITHYLKLGSSRERLEQERMAIEVRLGEAKIEQMASQKKIEELYGAALIAMSSYQGRAPAQLDMGLDDED